MLLAAEVKVSNTELKFNSKLTKTLKAFYKKTLYYCRFTSSANLYF